jgi:hypothetical protein
MDNYLICENPSCRFVLDRRLNGKSLPSPQPILKKCPSCRSEWSSVCPFCSQALTIKFVQGHAHASCCGRRLRAQAEAA